MKISAWRKPKTNPLYAAGTCETDYVLLTRRKRNVRWENSFFCLMHTLETRADKKKRAKDGEFFSRGLIRLMSN